MAQTLSDVLPLAIRNPSRDTVRRLLSVSKMNEIRGIVDPDTSDVLIWKATEAAYRQVAKSIDQGVIDPLSPFRLVTWEQINIRPHLRHAPK